MNGNSQKLLEIDNLLIEFQTFLVDKKLKAEINQKQIITKRNDSDSHNTNNIIPYVEKLLNIQIPNHRKFATSLILAPYFVNIQNLSDWDSFSTIKQWVLKCNELEKAKPSRVF